jgi:TRAP-type mannitol/chloroaromatic compound transport system substrate-binding protein
VQRVHESVVGFREQARQWHKISEMAYYEARE